jgi:tetratricopeptide (TPR) repeat protein
VVGLNEATGLPVAESLKYLDGIATTQRSAILTEKEGDLRRSQKRLSAAVEAYTAAAKLDPSPRQKLRLLLVVGELQSILGREQEAFDAYLQLVTEMPDYPDVSAVYQQLAGLARKLNKEGEAQKFTKQAEETGRPK